MKNRVSYRPAQPGEMPSIRALLKLYPQQLAQNLSKLNGKVLRIDVGADGLADGFPADATRNYAIPPDNPFITRVGADPMFELLMSKAHGALLMRTWSRIRAASPAALRLASSLGGTMGRRSSVF